MKKPGISITIIKEKIGYSAHAKVKSTFIGTQARNYNELKENILDAVNFAFEEEGYIYQWDELQLVFDLPSFFHFYKVINAKALSERIGMNQSLLAQYIHGHKTPSKKQKTKILTGLRQIGQELSEINFLM
jgi:hypothetical protein